MAKRFVTGWKLPDERLRLLDAMAPRCQRIVADHATTQTSTGADLPLPREANARVLGEFNNDEGVQALILQIGERGRIPSPVAIELQSAGPLWGEP